MRNLIVVLLFSVASYAQDSTKVNITHLSFEAGRNQLWHGGQTANRFSNSVQDQSVMAHLDSNLNVVSRGIHYAFFSYGLNVGFKKKDSKFRYEVGVSADARRDRYYLYRKDDRSRVDTVYQSYQNTSQLDTLFKDSVTNHSLSYSLRSSTFFGSFEGLYDVNLGPLKFSTGIGVMVGVSISSEVFTTYGRSYQYALTNQEGFEEYSSPKEAITAYTGPQPSVGSFHVTNNSKVNGRVIIKPFLPLYLELGLGKNKFWKHLALSYKGRVGAEFQIIKNAGVNPRVFFSQHLAVTYKI